MRCLDECSRLMLFTPPTQRVDLKAHITAMEKETSKLIEAVLKERCASSPHSHTSPLLELDHVPQ